MLLKLLRPIFGAIILSSCATIPHSAPDEQGYIWTLSRNPIDRENWRYVTLTDGLPMCRGSYACSTIKQPNQFCIVYTPANAPEWVRKHEEKHCMGYNHQPRTLDEIRKYLPQS